MSPLMTTCVLFVIRLSNEIYVVISKKKKGDGSIFVFIDLAIKASKFNLNDNINNQIMNICQT